MALSAPRVFYGIHSVSPYSRSTGEFYGILRVLENSSIGLTAETISLMGGSNKFSWSEQIGSMTAEMVLSFSEYPNFVFELFAGNAPTDNAAEASGAIDNAFADKFGTVINATTGIASVTVESGETGDLKLARYVIKVISGTTVDVFISSDLDSSRGDNLTMQNDLLKITATALTVPNSGATVSIPGTGLEITGGSGTVNLETAGAIGDTATISTRPINTDSMDVTVGQVADQIFPEFGAVVMAAKLGDGKMVEIDALRCVAAGLPIGFSRNAYSPAEVTVKLMYDDAQDGVFKVRHVVPSTP